MSCEIEVFVDRDRALGNFKSVNFRGDCSVELQGWRTFQVKIDWLRNILSVGMRHYSMTTEEHFAAAVKGEPKAAQQVHAKARNAFQIVPTAHEKTPQSRCFATVGV